MSTDQKPSRPATWDDIETGFHEYAADLTRAELGLGGGVTSYPPDFADWRVGMRAAREWLAAHDARVRRDAAREALDGLAAHEEERFLRLHTAGAPIAAEKCSHARFAAENYKHANYPDEETP